MRKSIPEGPAVAKYESSFEIASISLLRGQVLPPASFVGGISSPKPKPEVFVSGIHAKGQVASPAAASRLIRAWKSGRLATKTASGSIYYYAIS